MYTRAKALFFKKWENKCITIQYFSSFTFSEINNHKSNSQLMTEYEFLFLKFA